MLSIDEFLIHRYYETIPNWIEKKPDELWKFFDSLKDSLESFSWEIKLKYLMVLHEYHQRYGKEYSKSDIEFIIDHLESTDSNWNSKNLNDLEVLLEVIDTYNGKLSNESEGKYENIRNAYRNLKP